MRKNRRGKEEGGGRWKNKKKVDEAGRVMEKEKKKGNGEGEEEKNG